LSYASLSFPKREGQTDKTLRVAGDVAGLMEFVSKSESHVSNSKPPVVHNGGCQTSGPSDSSSGWGDNGYYK
jgi:hypothetical protein